MDQMVDSKIHTIIVEIATYICVDNDTCLLNKLLEDVIYKEYYFSDDDIIQLQIVLDRISDKEFIFDELNFFVANNEELFNDEIKILILIRTVLYYLIKHDQDVLDRCKKLAMLFKIKEDVVSLLISLLPDYVSMYDFQYDGGIGYFFEIPDKYDEGIFKIIRYIKNEVLYRHKEKLKYLNSGEFQHIADKEGFEAIKSMSGIEDLSNIIFKYGIERMLILQKMGSTIKVTEKNFPRLYKLFLECCEILDIKTIPQLFIEQGFINAYTAGADQHIIVLSSASLGCLTDDELMFVLGHELGHIKCGHVFYYWMASSILPLLGNIIGNFTLGIGNLVSNSIRLALLNWTRNAEFSADRAGLLTCQNYNSAITTLMKISGAPIKYYSKLDTESFLNQAREFKLYDSDSLNALLKTVSIATQTHPWTVMRAAYLEDWLNSGAYDLLIDRYKYPF